MLGARCYNKPFGLEIEYHRRRQEILADLAEHKLEALLVSSSVNLRYLTGFTGSNGRLLLHPAGSVLFTDPRYSVQARRQTGCKVRVVKGPMEPAVAAAVGRAHLKRVGFENTRIPYETHRLLDSLLPGEIELKPVGVLIERRRMVKSPAELERMRLAARINGQAFQDSIRRIRPGMKEIEVAGEIDYRMRKRGAEAAAFETIVASGPRSALPHARPEPRPVLVNQLLLVDMGAARDGYASDMTRMLAPGKATRRMREWHAAVLEAQLAAVDAVREGVTAGQVDAAARRVLRRHGLDRLFAHATGHGLGLEVHEAPRLGRHEKTRLLAGMVITIEPGVYQEGWGGIRIEDTVVVTRAGCEVLTPVPKQLVEI